MEDPSDEAGHFDSVPRAHKHLACQGFLLLQQQPPYSPILRGEGSTGHARTGPSAPGARGGARDPSNYVLDYQPCCFCFRVLTTNERNTQYIVLRMYAKHSGGPSRSSAGADRSRRRTRFVRN